MFFLIFFSCQRNEKCNQAKSLDEPNSWIKAVEKPNPIDNNIGFAD